VSVIVRGEVDEDQVSFDYGNYTDDLFGLSRLMEGSDVTLEECTVLTYALSGDIQDDHDSTHFVIVTINDPGGMLYLQDRVVSGTFFCMLAQGEKLKGFHCDKCARNFMKWFINSQQFWKDKYHEITGGSVKNPVTVH